MAAVIRFSLDEILRDIQDVVECIEICLTDLCDEKATSTGFDANGYPTFELHTKYAREMYTNLVKAIDILGEIWYYQVSTSVDLHTQLVQKMVFDEAGRNTDRLRVEFKLLSDPRVAYQASC